MPQSPVIDLDVLAPEPKRVKLVGQEYLLPGDIPVADMLEFEALAQRAEEQGEDFDDAEGMKQLYARVFALFRVHQPDLESIPLGAEQLIGFVPAVYGGADEGDDQDAEGKPQEQAAGTTSTGKGKPRAPKKARSRS